MRSLLIFVSFLLFALTSFGQPLLRYGTNAPTMNRDVVPLHDSFKISYWVVNIDPSDSFQAQVYTYCRTDAGTDSAVSVFPRNLALKAGDSALVTAMFTLESPVFKMGEQNKVTFWPIGGNIEKRLGKRLIPDSVLVDSSIYLSFLRYGSLGAGIDTDTVEIGGDSFSVYYWLVNANPHKADPDFSASVITRLSSNKATAGASLGYENGVVNIPQGDSVLLLSRFVADTIVFNENEKAIVVVWPTGGGTENAMNKATVQKEIFVKYPLSVREPGNPFNGIRVYPNPMRNAVTLEVTDPTRGIRNLYLTDMHGRVLRAPELVSGQADMGYLAAGVYVLQIHLSDGQVALYRIIKQ